MRESLSYQGGGSQRLDVIGPSSAVAAARSAVRRAALPQAGHGAAAASPAVRESLGSAGRPLDAPARAFMESRFGRDLSGVRVHTDSRAEEAARALGARAYTVGRNVYFGRGQFRPGTSDGDRLLAHEVAHTIQQGPSAESARAQPKLEVSRPGDASESEADAAADAVMSGRRAPLTQARPVVVARNVVPGLKSSSGTFTVSNYSETDTDAGNDTSKKVGAKIDITFNPDETLVTDKIAFVQIMKTTKNGSPYLFENEKPRATDAKSGDAGWAVDRLAGMKSPIYAQENDATEGGNTIFGYRKSKTDFKNAWMHDGIGLNRSPKMTVTVDATTFALDAKANKYLGGVSWGFATDAAGKTTKKTEALHSAGDPSGVQKSALEKWNEQSALADTSKRNAPDQEKVPVP